MVRYAREGGLSREPKFNEVPLALTQTPKDIAFSGDGEPTMLHNFDECVRVAAEVKRAEGLAAMQAFMGGKIKVQGDMMKIMSMQTAVPQTDITLKIAEEIKAITK